MSLFVKICGLTDPHAAECAARAGVQAIGFVFAASPRRVSLAQAHEIAKAVPADVLRVAVFRRPTPAEILEVVEEFRPDVVQADHDTLPRLEGVELLPVYREGGMAPPDGGRFLFEGPVSGVGRRVALDVASGAARSGEMILAGGLDPGNVGEAVTMVRPFGVDVSSGVETTPGVKSPELIESFVAEARAAEERLVST